LQFQGLSQGQKAPKQGDSLRDTGHQDVKLSNISRALYEQQSLIKTEDRFSRNLDDVEFTDVEIKTQEIPEAHLLT